MAVTFIAPATTGDLAISDSTLFRVGPNYSTQNDGGWNSKRATFDEFIRILPFEAVDERGDLTIGRPVSITPAAAFLPNATAGEVGAEWVTRQGEGDAKLTAEVGNLTYEGATFAWLSSGVKVPGIGWDEGSGVYRGRVERMLRVAALRELGRGLANGAGTAPNIRGLAGFYDSTSSWPADPQVLNASGVEEPPTQLRQALRRACPSGDDGLGVGPNGLLMSQRARDRLLKGGTGGMPSVGLTYAPDALAPGRLRPHYFGVPIYVTPIREDEDATVTGTTPTYLPAPTSPDVEGTSVYAVHIGGETGLRVQYLRSEGTTYDRWGFSLRVEKSGLNREVFIEGAFRLVVPERQAAARMFAYDISSEAA